MALFIELNLRGAVFMVYEGFQLLTCDYDDIINPRKMLPRALLRSSANTM